MENWHPTRQAAAVLVFVLCCFPSFRATAQTIGAACSSPASAGTPSLIQSGTTGQLLICNGSTWGLAEAITTGGSVGIGTASPANQLDILKGSGSGYALSVLNNSNGNMLILGDNAGTILTFQYNAGTGVTTLTSPLFGVFEIATQGNQSIALMPNGTGNVGIGTTTPKSSLHIVNGGLSGVAYTGNETGLIVENNGSGNGYQGFRVITSSGSGGFNITNAGNVGIGSTSPVSSLDISQKTDALILPVGTSGQRPTGTNGMVRYNSTAAQLEGYINGSWAGLATSGGAITLGASGSVTNPQRRGDATTGLFSATTGTVSFSASGTDVADYSSTGETILTSTSQGSGLTVNGGVWGQATATSDQRLKKNIETIDHALERVEKLRGVSFEWRTREERAIGKDANLPTDQHQIGVIAQEVEPIFPEAVGTGVIGDNDKFLPATIRIPYLKAS